LSRFLEVYSGDVSTDRACCGAAIGANGFEVEDLIEPRPPTNARTTYDDFSPLTWARRWPGENIWKLRKRG